MTAEAEDGSTIEVPPIYNVGGPGWDEVSEYLVYYNPLMAEFISILPPGTPPGSTKVLTSIEATGILGGPKVWNDEFITDPDFVMEDIDLTSINIPTYLLYAGDDEICDMDRNKAALDPVEAVVR